MSEHQHSIPVHAAHGGCTCGESNGNADPVLDARLIPHAIRHASIFGALDSLAAGSALVLVAPHDPLPLLAQARERYAGQLSVDYLQAGPDAWHVRLGR